MMTVYDPTAYEMHFFAIPTPRDAKKLPPLHDFLNTAATQFANAVGKDRLHRSISMEDLTDFAERWSDRLTVVEHTQIPSGATLELDVRTLHDAVLLRTTTLHEGPFDLDQVKALDFCDRLPQLPGGMSNYLGVFRVLYVETDNPQEAQRAEIGKALATAFGWTWLADAEPLVTPLGTLRFGVPPRKLHQRPETPTLDLLFVGGRDAASIAESYPVHPFLVTLPELALCHLKVRNAAENIRCHWLQELTDRERHLCDLLPKEHELVKPPQELLDRNDDLTTRQASLVDAVAHVKAELRTMRVNRDNFVAAAQPFDRVADKLKELLIDRWMRGTELQAKNDMGYVKGTLQRAKTHFTSIQASAAADQARELKKINWWVIALAGLTLVIGALQVLTGLPSAYQAWKSLTTPSSAPP